MNDEQKTKEQLMEELVSNKLAAAHDTAEVLDLIVNRKRPILH